MKLLWFTCLALHLPEHTHGHVTRSIVKGGRPSHVTESITKANKPCGDWEPYQDEKCFKILDGLVNFADAENHCSAQDGQAKVLSIGSPEEQRFFEKYLFTIQKVVDTLWLGAAYKEGTFTWTDGSNLTYSNWLPGSPKHRQDYCLMMLSEDEFKGKWADESCLKKNLVVYQKGQILSLETMNTKLTKLQRELHQSQVEQAILKTQLEEAKNGVENLRSRFEMTKNPFPLGFIYVQLPKEKAPVDLWPSMTWTEVSSTYEGVFFRVAGGGAADFGAIQEEDAPKLTQVNRNACQSFPTSSCGKYKFTYSQSIPSNGTWSDLLETAVDYVTNIAGIDASKQYKWTAFLSFHHSTGEVRPKNMAVKVWKRTA